MLVTVTVTVDDMKRGRRSGATAMFTGKPDRGLASPLARPRFGDGRRRGSASSESDYPGPPGRPLASPSGPKADSDSESDSEAALGPCIQVGGALGTVRDLTRGSLSTMRL